VDLNGTHVTHCCYQHGCNYDEDSCVVASGKLTQEYSCEMCDTPDDIQERIGDLQEELEWSLYIYKVKER